jgi:ATP-dependent phosphofructokinase / diphosphate-dependent phosphofructokinase
MPAKPKNLLYAQSGGVSAVINASASAVIATARKHKGKIGKVFAAKNGILGVLREELFDTSEESYDAIKALAHTPGGAFGSCRYKLKDLQTDAAKYQRFLDVCEAHDIGYFLYNGGNDSADTSNKIAQLAAERGVDLICVGVPKTIDNDLAHTDFCPGAGSVARCGIHGRNVDQSIHL